MRCPAFYGGVMIILLFTFACSPGWRHQSGVQTLPKIHPPRSPAAGIMGTDAETVKASERGASRCVTFVLPEGWHWVMRGNEFIATRAGVFLQNIHIERIHVDDFRQYSQMHSEFSWGQWPFNTRKYFKKRFAPGMSPAEAAGVVLGSRANNSKILDLEVQEVVPYDLAGNPAFKTVYDFRLNMQGRKPPYRTICYGVMIDEWFYGISYTAVKRYYFQKDAETFDSVLQSFHLVENQPP